MRFRAEKVIEGVDAFLPQSGRDKLSVLDVGAMEGAEVKSLHEKGFHVSVLNVLGRSPVEGVAYLDVGSPDNTAFNDDEFDAVTIVDAYAYMMAGAYGMNAQEGIGFPEEVYRITRPGGVVSMCVPVGKPGIFQSREGAISVFIPMEATLPFQMAGFELVESDHWFRKWRQKRFAIIAQQDGIVDKEINQIGYYLLQKPKKESSKKKKSRKIKADKPEFFSPETDETNLDSYKDENLFVPDEKEKVAN